MTATSGTPEPLVEVETILQEAQRLVYGDRQASYGHPADDYACTGRLFSALINDWLRPWLETQLRWAYYEGRWQPLAPPFPVTPEPIPDMPARVACLLMVAVKLSREVRLHKRDNCVDGAGYFACAERCARHEAGEE